MMQRDTWMPLVVGALAVTLIYPLALIPVILADTLIGEAEFLRRVLYASQVETVAIVTGDWWSSLPVALACWLLIRVLRKGLELRQVNWAGGGIAVLGFALSLVPPYLPMVFAAMVLSTVLVNLLLELRGCLR